MAISFGVLYLESTFDGDVNYTQLDIIVDVYTEDSKKYIFSGKYSDNLRSFSKNKASFAGTYYNEIKFNFNDLLYESSAGEYDERIVIRFSYNSKVIGKFSIGSMLSLNSLIKKTKYIIKDNPSNLHTFKIY